MASLTQSSKPPNVFQKKLSACLFLIYIISLSLRALILVSYIFFSISNSFKGLYLHYVFFITLKNQREEEEENLNVPLGLFARFQKHVH